VLSTCLFEGESISNMQQQVFFSIVGSDLHCCPCMIYDKVFFE
jgi:hypothetical protein